MQSRLQVKLENNVLIQHVQLRPILSFVKYIYIYILYWHKSRLSIFWGQLAPTPMDIPAFSHGRVSHKSSPSVNVVQVLNSNDSNLALYQCAICAINSSVEKSPAAKYVLPLHCENN